MIQKKTAHCFLRCPSAYAAETAATDFSVAKEYARHGRKEYMARHSFIQMSKLSNVKGRISYITSHARQENLYATYRTADNEFWSNLARESQQEFKRSGTEGKCIEARELIIALPEVYTRYEPQEVLEDFTEEFRRRYGVECVSALHHNKRKPIIISILSSAKENCFLSLTSR